MKRILLAIFIMSAASMVHGQSLDELKNKKADLEAQRAEKQAEADAFNGEIGSLASQIEVLSGWQKGMSGLLGLNIGGSNNWRANANPNNAFSSLNFGLNGFANNIKDKSFWRNTLTANVGWQGLDTDTNDDAAGSGFLSDRNSDVLIGSSLYGHRLNQDIALSGLGDLNTSVFNFLNPGTFDLGVGATWTPHTIPNLTVVFHPLTFHWAFSALDGVASQTSPGMKLKATYSHEFPGGVVWSSNLGSFIPYGGDKIALPADDVVGVGAREAGLFEYTWINSINIADVWKGIGIGFTFGLRGAKFEHPDTQTFQALGLTYGF